LARPAKWRRIENLPKTVCFIPAEIPPKGGASNILLVEELEAIRLKDLLGLEQEDCAERMMISRPTFRRILLSAREKIADSLVKGKAIRVGGGNYARNICALRCADCGREWNESYDVHESEKEPDTYVCPGCGSPRVICAGGYGEQNCRQNCRRHGRNRF